MIERPSMYATESKTDRRSMYDVDSTHEIPTMYDVQSLHMIGSMYDFKQRSDSQRSDSQRFDYANGRETSQTAVLSNQSLRETPVQILDRPLRVAHLNAALIPAGIEYWLASLQRYADPSKLQFIKSVILTDWVDPRQIPRMGMPIEVGRRDSVIAASSQCDILLISDPGRDSAEVARWILEAKPPLVVFVAHGDGAYTADRMAGIGPAVDHIVAVTDHVRREVCGSWPVSVILNGVDPRRLVRTRPRPMCRRLLGFAHDDFVVGFVGRFSEEKNPQLVVEAVRHMPLRTKLLLVGHGCMEEELRRMCEKHLKGRHVILEGDGDLGDLYAAMDSFVMPSRLEGYGLVAMEAMMSGVPVVATPFGMIADLVTDHVDGMVVSTDANSISAALKKLASFPALRQSIIAGGRRLAQKTGYASQMASDYEELLTRLWSQAVEHLDGDRHADR